MDGDGDGKITCSRYLDLAKMNRQRHIAPDRIYLHMHIWPEISAFLSGPLCLGVCRSVNILLIFESRHRTDDYLSAGKNIGERRAPPNLVPRPNRKPPRCRRCGRCLQVATYPETLFLLKCRSQLWSAAMSQKFSPVQVSLCDRVVSIGSLRSHLSAWTVH